MTGIFDVVVIGAGAAGVAAGRRLAAAGLSFLIVEAADRVGGRARTLGVGGMPVDLGCGWLHSADRNPLVQLAEDSGYVVDRTPPSWGRQFADLGFSREDQEAAAAAFDSFERRLRESPPPDDRAASGLDPDCPWNATIEARSGYTNGVELSRVSVQDYLAYADAETDTNWRLPQGYGALIADLAHDLPISLSTFVTCIDRRAAPLTLETSSGSLSARTVIVTVPTAVLANGTLRFLPALEGKQEAAAALPLGLADKLFLEVDGAGEFDPDSHMLGNPRRAETGSYYLRPFGRPLIECFFGGGCARLLEAEGPRAAAAFATDELVDLFGSSMRRRLRPAAASQWGREPAILGSYSHALPGAATMRATLVAPVEERIFFAGEACSQTDFSTAHGAWASGEAAAEAALSSATLVAAGAA